jgi:hypothetical protein
LRSVGGGGGGEEEEEAVVEDPLELYQSSMTTRRSRKNRPLNGVLAVSRAFGKWQFIE